MKIAIFAREIDKRWHDKLTFIINSLSYRGAELIFYAPFYKRAIGFHKLAIPASALFHSYEDMDPETDIFLSLGGDGTLLESLTYIRDRGIPVAGINFGRLGFLTTADSEPSHYWIERLINKDYKTEKRSLLKLSSGSYLNGLYPYALNEVSVQRQDPSMLSVTLKIDGAELPPYWSDGMVIATPTGSTAYSLSLGGPIMIPASKAVIVAPIAPHNLNIRPLVVSDESIIEVTVTSRRAGAVLSLDNRSVIVSSGEKFMVSKAEFDLNFISLSSNNFIEALKEKLFWGEDRRNT
ncbi:NAD kinase [bioreactor metagenome]|jgi:NAD+ kinase|uniref:NAD kinase n=1 Tax=bioreactor metagenome TaxID=1076179 RepID=A0A644VIF6_9ZZZZ|nr:NAD(+)/NADH kinase [Bacteroidales bacterium]MBP8678449.1 NAD(+)/NADH kinase [Bacteroidales bacterium]MBP9583957.1 NAD(+)/NADH kinase [Bacteroidales bacterium]MBP9978855.1 NAD(+)/NADH kinase [Bacteroidales bacterium]WRQ32783.1 NAD(+)/NADH kinase [Bacteroidales bacterium MB20-C3-3]